MSEIAAVAISLAKPGYEEELREALEGLIGPTRNESGVLQYEMYRDLREPRRFVFIERWENEDAFNAHVKSAHVAAYHEKVDGWIEHSELRTLAKLK
jgi:quinol monooxygenase YgiN